MNKTNLLTKLLLLCLIVVGSMNAWADNGDVLFSQNFNSATGSAYGYSSGTVTLTHSWNTTNTLEGLVGTGQNLFTSLYSSIKKGDIAINSSTGGNKVDATGIFQVYSSGDNAGYWSMNRTTNFAETAPTALKISMKIWFNNLSSGSNSGVSFAVGDGFDDGLTSTRQAAKNVHSGFGITQSSSPKLTVYDANTVIYNTAITSASWLTITWVINNTGDALEYADPGSGTTTVNNDCFDLWIGNTKVVSNQAATTATKDLQNIYIGNKEET